MFNDSGDHSSFWTVRGDCIGGLCESRTASLAVSIKLIKTPRWGFTLADAVNMLLNVRQTRAILSKGVYKILCFGCESGEDGGLWARRLHYRQGTLSCGRAPATETLQLCDRGGCLRAILHVTEVRFGPSEAIAFMQHMILLLHEIFQMLLNATVRVTFCADAVGNLCRYVHALGTPTVNGGPI